MDSRRPEGLEPVEAWLAMPLAARSRAPSAEEQVAARVRLVLETRPGTLPWAPELGCDLSSLVGRPATADTLTTVASLVRDAVRRGVPGVILQRCDVRLVTHLGAAPGRDRALPVAESALVPFSLEANLEVALDLLTATGPLSLSARITP